MLLRGGRVAQPGKDEPEQLDIRIVDERFSELRSGIRPIGDETVYDLEGLMVLPGGIDSHVHFDTPGFTDREDFLHGSAEAARGGITTIIDMPCTSLPPVTSVPHLEHKVKAIQPLALIDYGLYGGLAGPVSGETYTQDYLEATVRTLAPYVLGFKAYLLSGMESFPRLNHEALKRAIHACAAAGRPLLLHAEDADYVYAATERIQARLLATTQAKLGPGGAVAAWAESGPGAAAATRSNSGVAGAVAARAAPGAAEAGATKLSGATPTAEAPGAAGTAATWDDYVDSRPEAAELVAVAAAVQLAGIDVANLHIVHVGTGAAAQLAHEAGASCETCGHYLAFTRDDFAEKGASLKTAPPVKEAHNRDKLWQYLKDGTIDFVTSDHAPARPEEKRTGSVWTDYGGIPGVGTTYPYLFSEGYLKGRLSLAQLQALMAGAKARRFGLADRKGAIAPGLDADFVIMDPAARTVLRGAELLSKGKDTPFDGMELRGAILGTWLRGKAVYLNPEMKHAWGRFINMKDSAPHPDLKGILVSGGYGQWLRWGSSEG
jgi:dihydroorotase-like cyclic amidohydrolase